ncbi:long-chain-fatty-acid--CoA ligase [Pseudodonghicola flavimaris]|uniref:Long-chain-fatty-acid--CoA ligase n=1 Tax=Pseudodonghicola flavimaris TaxID=3050036 RepID=A0ABT7EYB3_9RHOB|nr:long-chain-fatty-acid--CoA ligase [Pseudodonghicola flavimaris]MDK3017314.1 long-chain-fatty-acid--CoA ligase [Pseudodonghicola flavimaris]
MTETRAGTGPTPAAAPAIRAGAQSPFWPAGLPAHLDFPQGNAVGNLEHAARRAPDRPALYYYGRTTRYAELYARVEALAGYLQHRGLRPGDRVLVDLQNSPQFVTAFHAILRADAVVVPINPMNTTEELEHYARDSGARLAIVGDELVDRFRPLMPELFDRLIVAHYADEAPTAPAEPLPPVMQAPRAALRPETETDFEAAIVAGHRPTPYAASSADIAVMPYSSGTTGKPKACMHPHSTVAFTAAAQAKWYGLDDRSVMTSFMPMFHVAGMQASMSAGIFAGAALVIMTRWDRDIIPDLFTRHKVTWWSAAPTMIVDVMASEKFDPACLAHITVLTGGGASMPAAVALELRDRYGLEFCEGYGLTETISATHINPPARPKPQCLGLPIFDTLSIVVDPDTLAEKPQGELGEILISGPQVMAGYWNRPEATAETLIPLQDRLWLRTGDLGYVDAEGYFFIVDRLKRMISVSGFKVWPAECETLLYRHPAVQECCVISAPDPYRGETVKALIVLKPGQAAQVDARTITEFARAHMAAYKIPRIVEFVDSLPQSGSRKVDWRALQQAEWSAKQ